MVLGQLQRARRKVITRIRPYKALLGDATNQVYADVGFYWVRPLAQMDNNGNSQPGVPYQVRSGTALVVPRGGRQVWIGTGLDGHLTVLGFVHEDLVQTDVGIDPRSLQPNDPYRAWIKLKQIQNFRALPLATGNTASMKVQVRQLFYYTETGDLVRYNGTNSSSHIDLTAHVPAANLQRYVVLWLRVYNPRGLDDIQVTYSSTISSLDDVLSFDELQECADQSDADTIPIQAFRLHDAQTTLVIDDTIDVDLRQFINMPQVYGFPNHVSRQYRIHAAHSVIMPEVVTIASGGAVEIQTDGVLVILSLEDCDCGSGAGGTVTSVAQTVPAEFSVAGSPITTSGTLAITKANQSANTVWAGPTSGGAAQPAFRALVDADVPNILTLTEIKDTFGGTILELESAGASAIAWLKTINEFAADVAFLTVDGTGTNIRLVILPKGSELIELRGETLVNGKFRVSSTTFASHPAPSMTTTEQNALTPAAGDIIYNTTTGKLRYYTGSAWADIDTTGANTALSNLASVAINTTLVSDTDNTDDLGTSSVKWREIFTNLATLEERTAPSTPASGDGSLYNKVSPTGQLFFVNDSGVHKQATESIAILWDEKTSGTNGGTSSTTTWNNRDLNTEHYDPDGIVSISSNQFTPVAGDYDILVFAPFLGGSAASSLGRSRVYNVTAAAVVKEGQNTFGITNGNAMSMVRCKFTANGSDAYRIDTYTSVGRATNGLGAQVGDGSAEQYTTIYLRKIA